MSKLDVYGKITPPPFQAITCCPLLLGISAIILHLSPTVVDHLAIQTWWSANS